MERTRLVGYACFLRLLWDPQHPQHPQMTHARSHER
jgi:hypothetical protein